MEPKYTASPKNRGYLQVSLYPNLSYSPAKCVNIRMSSLTNISTKLLNPKTRGWEAAGYSMLTQAKGKQSWRLILYRVFG